MATLRDGLLAGLNPAQVEAVTTDAAPLCILAGAGSGKTRVLTRRIAWRLSTASAEASHVLALTFTRKAAGELNARLTQLGVRDRVTAGTFHSVAYAQLRRRAADRDEKPPVVLDRKTRLLVPLLPRPRRSDPGVPVAEVATEIEWAKARLVRPADYAREAAAAGREPPLEATMVAEIYDQYEREKRRRGLVDFDDLLILAGAALDRDREFAAAQRWHFRHLFVDEFQDVNPAQFRLLEGWRGNGLDLCVVGDPNQAIYSWNGADASYLTGFRDRFPGAGVVRLDDNYRSSPQVLTAANAVLGAGPRATPPLRATQPDGPLPAISEYESDEAEARGVAAALRAATGPETGWSQLAVLARTHAQLVLFERALRAAGVPSRVRGGARFLEQAEVREALASLPEAAPITTAVVDLDELAAEAPEASDRRGLLDDLVRLAGEYQTLDAQGSVHGFKGWLTATVRADDAEVSRDAVELATFHAAKGLEWAAVFVVGLERGLVPIAHAETAEAKAEERRLLYVAVTRAQQQLHLSWAAQRTFGTRTSTRRRSPYLDAIEAAVDELERTGEVDWQAHIAEQRRQVRAAGERRRRATKGAITVGINADPAVLEALRSWRTQRARLSGVPAFVIFHDTTLAAMAEAKPRDRAALLAVPGMGPVKAERYGEELLALVATHAS